MITKSKTFDVQLQPYPIQFVFSIGPDYKELIKCLRKSRKSANTKKSKKSFSNLLRDAKYMKQQGVAGCCLSSDRLLLVIVHIDTNNSDNLNNVLVHELLHAIIYVANKTGSPINRDSSEPFCYLIEGMYNFCQQRIAEADELCQPEKPGNVQPNDVD